MTLGDVPNNIRCGIEMAHKLLGAGYAPYCPHLSHFQQLMFPNRYEDWMLLDFEWIPLCDAMLRLSGESRGAEREVKLADACGIPVYYDLCAFLEDFPVQMEITDDTTTYPSRRSLSIPGQSAPE